MQKLKNIWLALLKFYQEVKVEMLKVTWPSRNELIGSTIVVITAVAALTLIITTWDSILGFIMQVAFVKKGA